MMLTLQSDLSTDTLTILRGVYYYLVLLVNPLLMLKVAVKCIKYPLGGWRQLVRLEGHLNCS